MRYGCAEMEFFKSSLPRRKSVLKWVTSELWPCLCLCPASHARSEPVWSWVLPLYVCHGEGVG